MPANDAARLRRVAGWFGWGALAGVGFYALLPVLLGGTAVLPIVIVAYEDGVLESLISAAVGLVAVLILSEGAVSVSAALVFLAAILLGTALRRAAPLWQQIAPAFLLIGAAVAGYFLLPTLLGGQQVTLTPAEAKEFGQILGLPARQVLNATKQMAAMLPAIVPLYGGLVLFEGFYFSRWALAARRHELPSIRPFSLWRAPEWLPPLYLVLFALQLAGGLLGWSADLQRWIGFGVLWVEVPLMLIGLAVLNYWLTALRVPTLLRVVLLGALLMLGAFAEILIWVGILDAFIDLRRLQQKPGDQ